MAFVFYSRCPHDDDDCKQSFTYEETGDEIEVERCVLPEVYSLWQKGIITYCSCCGHDTNDGYIVVGQSDADRMRALGYEEKTDHHQCKHFKNVIAFKAKHCREEMQKYPEHEPTQIITLAEDEHGEVSEETGSH